MVKNTLIQKVFFLCAMFCIGAIALINIQGLIFTNLKELWILFKKINHKEYLLYLLIFFILLVLGIYLLVKKIKFKNRLQINSPVLIAISIFLVSLITKLIFIFVINTQQYSDFQLFYWVTVEIAKKVPKYLSQYYFSIWAYQVGFPAIMSPIVKIFGANVMPLIVANCIFMSVTNVFIYLLARQFSAEKVSRICSFAFAFFPFALSLSSVYSNQHLAGMFFTIGLYTLLYKKTFAVKRSIIAGLLFAFGNMVRPEAIIVIMSLVAVVILINFKKSSLSDIKNNLKKVFVPIACTILFYFIGINGISQYFIYSGLNPHGLANNFPLYKFVIGFNHTTAGTFSKADADYLFESQYFIENPEERDQEARRMITERLAAGPFKLGSLMAQKARIMWSCNSSWYPSFINVDLNKSLNIFGFSLPSRLLLNLFTFIDFLFFTFIFTVCAISMFFSFKSKENSIGHIVIIMLFMGTFFIYFLIEVQHRYSYFIFPALFVLTSIGLNDILSKKDSLFTQSDVISSKS